ncbi:MAG TPA: LysR family transcriptional regulator [Pseudolabrys sp.]|nr:LysR family transcriptional regulator [Pseudolabrys sp.]
MELGARLRAFAAFVRRGSFTGAAEDLHISQPAVSKHIADLERVLGAALIARRSRELTAAGEFLARHVLRAEAILAQAVRGIAALREPDSAMLSIRASGTPGTYLLPDVIARFQEAHPAIHIDFELATSAEVVKAVRTHRAEIGIAGGFVAAPEIDAEPLIEDEIIIVGARRHAGKRLTRDDLEALTWISREEGSATRVIADEAMADVGIQPRLRLALPSWESIKLAVRRGQGIAACSRFSVIEELEAGTLVMIPFLPWKVRRNFSIVRIRDAALTPPAEQFVSMLRERWSGTYSWPGASAKAKRRR